LRARQCDSKTLEALRQAQQCTPATQKQASASCLWMVETLGPLRGDIWLCRPDLNLSNRSKALA
jgi:hypothetical protein